MNRKVDLFGRVAVLTFGLAIAGSPAVVDAAGAEALETCQSMEDNAARLACYDAALSPKPAPAAEPESPEPAAPQESEPKAAPPVVEETKAAAEPPAAAPAPTPEPAARAAAQPDTLNDEIGREAIDNTDRDSLAVRGRLARCDRARSGKFVFYFDNGQIWRQKSSVRVSWKECDFDVTISKDVFGYAMVRDGETRKVRIERVR